MVILALLIGLVLGAAAVLLWARGALRARDADAAAARRELELERTGSAERAALLERSQATWEERMKAVTGDALAKSQTSLLQLTEAKLAPIKETLQKFETHATA